MDHEKAILRQDKSGIVRKHDVQQCFALQVFSCSTPKHVPMASSMQLSPKNKRCRTSPERPSMLSGDKPITLSFFSIIYLYLSYFSSSLLDVIQFIIRLDHKTSPLFASHLVIRTYQNILYVYKPLRYTVFDIASTQVLPRHCSSCQYHCFISHSFSSHYISLNKGVDGVI